MLKLKPELQKISQCGIRVIGALVVALLVPTAVQSATPDGYLRPETVQADISARRVAVTSSFSGTEVVVFGAVDNSRQSNAAAGYYDIVVVIEGTKEELITRKKDRVGGIWINSGSQQFSDVPSYYAISSTRPLEEIASDAVLDKYRIGFSHVHMKSVSKNGVSLPEDLVKVYRESVVRLKKQNGLYLHNSYSTGFVGKSLFRTTLHLPANVTVGPFAARIYLFREGKMLSQYETKLTLEREGVELLMHNFAFGYPLLYGIFAVIVAVSAGLAASQIFKKKT